MAYLFKKLFLWSDKLRLNTFMLRPFNDFSLVFLKVIKNTDIIYNFKKQSVI
jgi:hypothetical protein